VNIKAHFVQNSSPITKECSVSIILCSGEMGDDLSRLNGGLGWNMLPNMKPTVQPSLDMVYHPI